MAILPLFAEERRYEITKMLGKDTKLLIPNLCSHFQVSPATIRNDLRTLERKGALKRTHGGAIPISKAGFEPAHSAKEVERLDEKQRIAVHAESLIENGDTILLDTGTTVMELAKLLTNKSNLTIVTNDLKIALLLESTTNAAIYFLGGNLRRNFHCTMGAIALGQIESFNVDKAFMAANGVCAEKGLTTPVPDLAILKNAMIRTASMVIVMADANKLDRVAFAQVAPLSCVDKIITDNGADPDTISRLRDKNRFLDVVLV